METQLRSPAESDSSLSPSLWISPMLRGFILPEPGKNTYRTPSDSPPCRALDEIPRAAASATEPSPTLPMSA